MLFLSRTSHKMQLHLSRSFSLITLIISLIRFTSSYDEHFLNCSQPFTCGTVGNLKYPFWGENRAPYCGLPGFELHRLDNDVLIITISSQKYRILATDPEARVLTVARADIWDDICPFLPINTSTDDSPFDYSFSHPSYLTFFYGCPAASMVSFGFPRHAVCDTNGSHVDVFFRTGMLAPIVGCTSVVNVPIQKTLASDQEVNLSSVLEVLHEGFILQWRENGDQCKKCVESGGQCGNDLRDNIFRCFCPDQPYALECPTRPGMF